MDAKEVKWHTFIKTRPRQYYFSFSFHFVCERPRTCNLGLEDTNDVQVVKEMPSMFIKITFFSLTIYAEFRKVSR